MATTNIRVFQGITGSAGQPNLLAKALREAGCQATSIGIGSNKFNYPSDIVLDCGTQDYKSIGRFIASTVDDYDVYHFHMRPALYQHPSKFHFPTFMDIVLLKALGKGVCFHFRGSEVRRADLFQSLNSFHYVNGEGSNLIKKFPVESQKFYIDTISSLVDRIFVTDPELQTYVPNSDIVPRLFVKPPGLVTKKFEKKNPLIVHAPSRQEIKGTKYVLEAVERLKREGHDFEFKLIENVPNEEAILNYAQADIVVDQLRIGWYGVLAVEAMALERAVVAYIRPDLQKSFGDAHPPVAFADPNTIYDVLLSLISDPDSRRAYAKAGARWFKQTHSKNAMIPNLIKTYEEIHRNPRKIDPIQFQNLLEHQVRVFKSEVRSVFQMNDYTPETKIEKFLYIWRNDGIRSAIRRVYTYYIN